jgi:hypothetical protein
VALRLITRSLLTPLQPPGGSVCRAPLLFPPQSSSSNVLVVDWVHLRVVLSIQTAVIAGWGLAAASLATSALLSEALTGRRGEQESSAAALHRLMFVAGGPVHGAGFGVLVGSLGLAGLRTTGLPRPLLLAGLASAAVGSLSPLYFVAEPAAWFIPAGGFSGLLVSGIAGVRLSWAVPRISYGTPSLGLGR